MKKQKKFKFEIIVSREKNRESEKLFRVEVVNEDIRCMLQELPQVIRNLMKGK